MLEFEYLNKKKRASQELFMRRLEGFIGAVPADIRIAVANG